MDVGNRLKNARAEAELTQETVAEKIGVSRQTVSSWENNKSYPDIVSVIKLSDLYSVSLDELLKEDKGMLEHLEKSTNDTRSRQKLTMTVQVAAFLVIWAAAILAFWFMDPGNAFAYSLLVFFLVLPVTIFVISAFIGKDDGWSNYKWLMLLFFGAMYMLADFATFRLANALALDKTDLPELANMVPGLLSSAAGLLVGTVIQAVRKRRAKE